MLFVASISKHFLVCIFIRRVQRNQASELNGPNQTPFSRTSKWPSSISIKGHFEAPKIVLFPYYLENQRVNHIPTLINIVALCSAHMTMWFIKYFVASISGKTPKTRIFFRGLRSKNCGQAKNRNVSLKNYAFLKI